MNVIDGQKRILYVSSSRSPWVESQSCEEHFRNAPYSIDAIMKEHNTITLAGVVFSTI